MTDRHPLDVPDEPYDRMVAGFLESRPDGWADVETEEKHRQWQTYKAHRAGHHDRRLRESEEIRRELSAIDCETITRIVRKLHAEREEHEATIAVLTTDRDHWRRHEELLRVENAALRRVIQDQERRIDALTSQARRTA